MLWMQVILSGCKGETFQNKADPYHGDDNQMKTIATKSANSMECHTFHKHLQMLNLAEPICRELMGAADNILILQCNRALGNWNFSETKKFDHEQSAVATGEDGRFFLSSYSTKKLKMVHRLITSMSKADRILRSGLLSGNVNFLAQVFLLFNLKFCK